MNQTAAARAKDISEKLPISGITERIKISPNKRQGNEEKWRSIATKGVGCEWAYEELRFLGGTSWDGVDGPA